MILWYRKGMFIKFMFIKTIGKLYKGPKVIIKGN